MSNPYEVVLESVDEAGEPESWFIRFSRLKTRDIALLDRIADESVSDAKKVVLISEMLESLISSAACGGVEVAVADLPVEVGVDAFNKHPLFRSSS